MNIMKQLTHKGLANLVVVGDKNLKNAVKVFVDRLAIKVENGVEGFEGFVGQIGFNVGFD